MPPKNPLNFSGFGGDGGNRTRVRKYFKQHFYKLIWFYNFPWTYLTNKKFQGKM
jgi:hypothetical protein